MNPSRFRVAVFDIDGTLAMMDKETGTYDALPGAVQALDDCRARGVVPVAYTNGTFFAPSRYYPLLADAGLVLAPGHIFTPAVVAAQMMAAAGYKRVMVMGAEGTVVPMQDAGIEVIEPRRNAPQVEAVLLGWTRDFNAEQLEAVVKAVWDGAKPFAGSVAPYFAGANGRLLGISGAIAAALENATDQKVTVFGKPEVAGLEMISAMTNASAQDMVVVGDDPKLEIRMARHAGSFAVGVTTGNADAAGFKAMPDAERAHEIIPSLLGFADQPWFQREVAGW